jgi:hypothetical protein
VTAASDDRDRDGTVTGHVSRPMTAAERQRRHRERKRREREAAGSGVGADGVWRAEFEGQREPFRPGHTLSVKHGARSPRVVGPLAEQIAAELLGDPGCPAYLRDPGWRFTIESWAQARAELILLREWRDRLTAEESATEHSYTDETEDRPAMGKLARRGHAQRVESVLAAIDRAERRAERLGARLGLDPSSRAKLGKSVTESFDLARFWAACEEAEKAGRPLPELPLGQIGMGSTQP